MQRRVYSLILLFLPVIVLAVALGYYRFVLPDGVAAIVNNEEITLAELDAAEARMRGNRAPAAGFRYLVLNELIAERLVLQEARKAGTRASAEDVAAEARRQRDGRDLPMPDLLSAGSRISPLLEQNVELRTLGNRFIGEKVAPPSLDPASAREAWRRWLQDRTARASIRIALSEAGMGQGSGCGGHPVHHHHAVPAP